MIPSSDGDPQDPDQMTCMISCPNVVKVVTDWEGYALYFSRSPLPFFRDKWKDLKDEILSSGKLLCYKHVGLYVYRRDFLLQFAACRRLIWKCRRSWSSCGFWKTVSGSGSWRPNSSQSGSIRPKTWSKVQEFYRAVMS